MLIFQFTLPREERRQVQAQPLTLQNFNPRSHERSDHITQSFVFRFFNFNPRSHERSDFTGDYTFEVTLISIHAPTRGATALIVGAVSSSLFQSTLPREERQLQGLLNCFFLLFQSTLPREERRFGSIAGKLGGLDFNPRSHERSDGFYVACLIFGADFNPRSHERSDIIMLIKRA